MEPTLRFVIAAIALVLALVDVIRSEGRALTSWGVILLALIHLVSDWDGAFD